MPHPWFIRVISKSHICSCGTTCLPQNEHLILQLGHKEITTRDNETHQAILALVEALGLFGCPNGTQSNESCSCLTRPRKFPNSPAQVPTKK